MNYDTISTFILENRSNLEWPDYIFLKKLEGILFHVDGVKLYPGQQKRLKEIYAKHTNTNSA